MQVKCLIDLKIVEMFSSCITELENPKPQQSVILLKELENYINKDKDISSKLLANQFKLTNQDYVDILELSERFNCKNIFGYYLVNVINVSDSVTNQIIHYVYSNNRTELCLEIDSKILDFVKINAKSKDEEENLYNEIIEKIKTYSHFCFYIFSLNLFQPVQDKENTEVFKNYKTWINDSIMVIPKNMN